MQMVFRQAPQGICHLVRLQFQGAIPIQSLGYLAQGAGTNQCIDALLGKHLDISDGSPIYPPGEFNGIAAFSHCGALAVQVVKPADVFWISCQAEKLLPDFARHEKIAIRQMVARRLTIRFFTSGEHHHHHRR
jgi:hypothetical protein